MRLHEQRETRHPVYSFGQGCEGDPLMDADLLAESIQTFRDGGGRGTINCNTNVSRPEAVIRLAQAGMTSLRVSLNSARDSLYHGYYRPMDYNFDDVRRSMREARERGIFVSLNLIFFPGITDTEDELAALARLVGENGVSMVQWRNLNIDPEWHFTMTADAAQPSPCMGLTTLLCPWLRYGYFNPWLGEKVAITAPMPGQWNMPSDVTGAVSGSHGVTV
ncbi:hypothetical protein AGMMS49974_05620 [Deltaproteobacteria bacterium]|nr:hypothetical protein AGMMS49974_05620 [Deltaproteobacteria bacterium]